MQENKINKDKQIPNEKLRIYMVLYVIMINKMQALNLFQKPAIIKISNHSACSHRHLRLVYRLRIFYIQ